MVKVTVSYITKKGSRNAPKHGREPKEHLNQLTHLYLNDQFIDSIGDISECRNLKVLFLQSNLISEINNLDFASNLTHLYLQRNKMRKIQGLDALFSLRKLYLGYNSISIVEGLENNRLLEELHIDHQNLPPGEELTFDPRSVAIIGQSLRLLNLEDNALTSLEDLVGLEVVEILNVSNNNLRDITKIQAFLSTIPSLIELDVRGNPACVDYRNRNKIIACTQSLQSLNGKSVSESTLLFMKRLETRHIKTTLSNSSKHSYDLETTLSELAHDLPEALAKDVTSRILQNKTVSKQVTDNARSELEQLPRDKLQDAAFYHFPAFKTSTCLQFEGHTIPRQFHRLMKTDPLIGKRHRSTKLVFSKEHNGSASQHIACETINSSPNKNVFDRGDII